MTASCCATRRPPPAPGAPARKPPGRRWKARARCTATWRCTTPSSRRSRATRRTWCCWSISTRRRASRPADEALRVAANLTTPDGTLAPPEMVTQVGIGTRVRMVFSRRRATAWRCRNGRSTRPRRSRSKPWRYPQEIADRIDWLWPGPVPKRAAAERRSETALPTRPAVSACELPPCRRRTTLTPETILAHPPRVLTQAQRERYFATGYLAAEELIPGRLAAPPACAVRRLHRSQPRRVTASNEKFDLGPRHSPHDAACPAAARAGGPASGFLAVRQQLAADRYRRRPARPRREVPQQQAELQMAGQRSRSCSGTRTSPPGRTPTTAWSRSACTSATCRPNKGR